MKAKSYFNNFLRGCEVKNERGLLLGDRTLKSIVSQE